MKKTPRSAKNSRRKASSQEKGRASEATSVFSLITANLSAGRAASSTKQVVSESEEIDVAASSVSDAGFPPLYSFRGPSYAGY